MVDWSGVGSSGGDLAMAMAMAMARFAWLALRRECRTRARVQTYFIRLYLDEFLIMDEPPHRTTDL